MIVLSEVFFMNKSDSFLSRVKVKVAQSCLTPCDPMDYTIHGILQARILECVAFPFSRKSSQPKGQTQVSHIAGRFFTNWAIKEEVDQYFRVCNSWKAIRFGVSPRIKS